LRFKSRKVISHCQKSNTFANWDNPEKSIGLYFLSPVDWEDDYFQVGRFDNSVTPNLFLVQLKKGIQGLLWLGELVCIKDQREYYRLLDVKPLPEAKKMEGISVNICEVDSKPDINALAWGRKEKNNPKLLDIKGAWQVNKKTRKIDVIPADRVECTVNWDQQPAP
jgi:hypothetical protein